MSGAHRYQLALYDGGMSEDGEPVASGEFVLTGGNEWLLSFPDGSSIVGDFHDYGIDVRATGESSCRVTITGRLNQAIRGTFDLPLTRRGDLELALNGRAEAVKVVEHANFQQPPSPLHPVTSPVSAGPTQRRVSNWWDGIEPQTLAMVQMGLNTQSSSLRITTDGIHFGGFGTGQCRVPWPALARVRIDKVVMRQTRRSTGFAVGPPWMVITAMAAMRSRNGTTASVMARITLWDKAGNDYVFLTPSYPAANGALRQVMEQLRSGVGSVPRPPRRIGTKGQRVGTFFSSAILVGLVLMIRLAARSHETRLERQTVVTLLVISVVFVVAVGVKTALRSITADVFKLSCLAWLVAVTANLMFLVWKPKHWAFAWHPILSVLLGVVCLRALLGCIAYVQTRSFRKLVVLGHAVHPTVVWVGITCFALIGGGIALLCVPPTTHGPTRGWETPTGIVLTSVGGCVLIEGALRGRLPWAE